MFVVLFGSMLLTQIHKVMASDVVPYDNIGIEWNKNPNLTKSEGCWDSRIWHWNMGMQQIYHTDESNYVNWAQDGLVESSATDGSKRVDLWKCAEFNQGNVRNESEIYDLGEYGSEYGWNNKTSSLLVEGSVILFEGIGYSGQNITFTSDVSDLRPYDWNDKACSLKLARSSCVTLFRDVDYYPLGNADGEGYITFQCQSYQPSPLKVSDKSSITLEGVVSNWHTSTNTAPGWTGAKFDVFATEDPYSPSADTLMLELYFGRDGGNLAWGNGIIRAPLGDNTYNILMAIDCWPQYAQRTVYPGSVQKWEIDVKEIIRLACDNFNNWWGHSFDLDFNKMSIVKIGFTVEAAWWEPTPFYVGAGCSLSRLRLAYTEQPTAPTAQLSIDPLCIDNASLVPGSLFNVSIRADIPANPGVAGIQFNLTWNAAFLKATNMEEIVFRSTMPPSEAEANLWNYSYRLLRICQLLLYVS